MQADCQFSGIRHDWQSALQALAILLTCGYCSQYDLGHIFTDADASPGRSRCTPGASRPTPATGRPASSRPGTRASPSPRRRCSTRESPTCPSGNRRRSRDKVSLSPPLLRGQPSVKTPLISLLDCEIEAVISYRTPGADPFREAYPLGLPGRCLILAEKDIGVHSGARRHVSPHVNSVIPQCGNSPGQSAVHPGMAVDISRRLVPHSGTLPDPEVCPVIIAGKTDSKPCCGGCARPSGDEFSPCGQQGDLI